ALKGLFNDTSSGYKREVNPPGITAISVFFSRSRFFATSVLCAEKESNTKRDFGLLPYLIRCVQTFSTHQVISFSFIHPFLLARIITLSGNSSRRTFTSLKIITGGSFVPSAIQAKTTVKFACSCPVDKIETILVPRCSTVVLLGKLKAMGVSSIFPIKDNG